MSELKLSGGEISVLKAIGLTGASINGEILQSRLHGFEDAELLDTIQGLMAVGYIVGSKDNVRLVPEMLKTNFKVNSSYIKTLQEAMSPRKEVKKTRRRRRE